MPDGSTIMSPPAGSVVTPAPQAAAPAPAPEPGPAVVPGVQPSATPPAPDASGYTQFTLPEGISVDEGLLTAFKPVAKELGLSQQQAQRIVDLQANAQKAHGESQAKAWDTTMTEWQGQARSDQEYGGAKFDENIAVATQAIKKFGSPELVKTLELTGVGNHPEMIRFAYRVAKAMQEAPMVQGGNAPAAGQDIAKTMFPNMA